ncbi:MAG: hypothetical protein ABUK06_02600, partial [Dehalococcoidales bacterium]
KWGNNTAITTTEEDLWSAGGAYAFPSDSGVSLEVVSSDAGDTTQVVTIEGLAGNFTEQSETITLNGTTAVVVPGTWTRVNRAFNSNSAVFDGAVSVQAAGAGAVYASLAATHQQTSQAIYTIPAGCTALILDVKGSINRTGATSLAADYFLNVREFGKVFRKKWHVGVQKDGNSNVEDNMIIPERVPEKTDIKVSGIAATTDVSGSAWFYVLVMSHKAIPGLSDG